MSVTGLFHVLEDNCETNHVKYVIINLSILIFLFNWFCEIIHLLIAHVIQCTQAIS